MTGSRADETSGASTDEPTDRGTPAGDDADGPSERWVREAWSAGSYAAVAPNYLRMGGHLVERTGVGADDAVLDVGCGTGTVALTAARRGARVTGVDVTPAMLDGARANAETADLDGISWREGDAAALPVEADAFDATLSNLGHMYADPPTAAARELCRVTRPGGRIGFTSWTPTSLYPAIAGEVMAVLSPAELPEFSEPPFLWGEADAVERRLGESVEALAFETGTVAYPALSPTHFWEQTAANSGMFVQALDAVDEDDRADLRTRVVDAIEPHFDEQRNAVRLEYLLTTATVTEGESGA